MTKRHLTIATRKSPLAMQQANLIKTLLMLHHPSLTIDLLGLTTQADERLNISLVEIGGKGLFVKELEEALLNGQADIAVHSMKDVPMVLPPDLCLSVMSKREDPRDVFISPHFSSLALLPRGKLVGTSSARRQAQLSALRSDIHLKPLRGNIHTRLQRLEEGRVDAIVLAAAGLKRMDLADKIRCYFSVEELLPAAGQGALGIECLADNKAILELIAPLNDVNTFACVTAERALCRQLNGGCKLPIAAYAHLQQGVLHLQGLVASQNGTRLLRTQQSGEPHDAEQIGVRAAEALLQQGAARILQEFTL